MDYDTLREALADMGFQCRHDPRVTDRVWEGRGLDVEILIDWTASGEQIDYGVDITNVERTWRLDLPPETPTEIAVAVISGIVQVAVELTSSQAVPTLSPRDATLAAVQAIEGIAGLPEWFRQVVLEMGGQVDRCMEIAGTLCQVINCVAPDDGVALCTYGRDPGSRAVALRLCRAHQALLGRVTGAWHGFAPPAREEG